MDKSTFRHFTEELENTNLTITWHADKTVSLWKHGIAGTTMRLICVTGYAMNLASAILKHKESK